MRQLTPTLTSLCLPSAPAKTIDLTVGFWLRRITMRQAKRGNKTQRHSPVRGSLITVTCSRPIPTKMIVLTTNSSLLPRQATTTPFKCREMARVKTPLKSWPPTKVRRYLLPQVDSRLDSSSIRMLRWLKMKGARGGSSIHGLIHHHKRQWWLGMQMTMAWPTRVAIHSQRIRQWMVVSDRSMPKTYNRTRLQANAISFAKGSTKSLLSLKVA